jgi:hypothetical protein
MNRLCPVCKDPKCGYYWNTLCDREIDEIGLRALAPSPRKTTYERQLEESVAKWTEEAKIYYLERYTSGPNPVGMNPEGGV